MLRTPGSTCGVKLIHSCQMKHGSAWFYNTTCSDVDSQSGGTEDQAEHMEVVSQRQGFGQNLLGLVHKILPCMCCSSSQMHQSRDVCRVEHAEEDDSASDSRSDDMKHMVSPED